MNELNNDIKTLKNILINRETYVRFSPIGTGIVGILFIIYYFFRNSISYISQDNLFFVVGGLSVFIAGALSFYNSYSKGEKLLPKSIINIIFNFIVIWTAYFVIVFSIKNFIMVFSIKDINIQFIKSYSLIFYGMLIILSRYNINIFIKNF